jgi:5'-nucleotidase (lipoprotein e(P4) family)
MKKIPFLLLVFFTACSTTKQTATALPGSSVTVSGKLFGSVFQQKAAEYKALCFQAYNIARLRLDQHEQSTGGKPKAIITDIDETVLDNSPYAVHQALQGKDYETDSWNEWTSHGMADTVPGAPAFLKYAASKGVYVFYINNRDERERAGTLQNLLKYNLPNADNEHLILRQTVSSKEERRQKVMADYEPILLIGDNLSDFDALFDKKTATVRDENTNRAAAEFGNRFIVLPNPVYGDWESALYNYNRYTTAQKDSLIKASAKSY